MKVYMGTLIMMRARIISCNIYKLLRNTIVGDVDSVKFDDDVTKLKHIHMGNLSERGMMELHKRNLLKGFHISKMDLCKYCILGK